jgi:putative ABC transport system permease protein
MMQMANSMSATMTALLGGIAGVSLLVGGIGIMNIMLVSVTERTREIGIRKALGARKRDIQAQFLVEALVLSLCGGILGIALGFALSSVARLLQIEPVVTTDSVLLAFGFSAAVGIVFGFYPAQKAAQLDPIDALRYE